MRTETSRSSPPDKLSLCHLPTPLWRSDALDALVGTEIWVKRDDMTGGAEAGNKLRKLEYLMAEARENHASVVITCGGLQSNHARATAIVAARLGLGSCLFLRTSTPSVAPTPTGNLLLDRMVGADLRLISPADWLRRNELLAQAADELRARGERPYVIPEGGSNALGSLGYVDAMREVRTQLDLGLGGGPASFDAVAFACGSGGTAAGIVLGAALWNVAPRVLAMAVCDDRAYFESVIGRIAIEAQELVPESGKLAQLVVQDRDKGPGYAVASGEQRRFIIEVARRTGLLLDPVYTGKALFALSRLEPRPQRVLFIHTGGLPGLLAQADVFADEL
ncbi:MAG: D-cysteine desulfhydrase family protein [Myxococcales bacterium]|nr:D-cysteine desulfhydrase family protein [Myxococcales bacterium]